MLKVSLLSTLLAAAVFGCSPNEPTAYLYSLSVENVPDGAEIFLGDEKLGHLEARDEKDTGGLLRFTLPPGRLLSKAGELSVRLTTPCGPGKSFPLMLKTSEAQEVEKRELAAERETSVSVDATVAGGAPAWPARVLFWMDAMGKTIAIGKAELRPQLGDAAWVYDLGCAAKHDVSVDGKVVGTMTPGDKSVEHYLVTAGDDVCYRASSVYYSRPGENLYGAGTTSTLLGGERVYALKERPRHFLKDAPSSTGGVAAHSVTELVRAPCTEK